MSENAHTRGGQFMSEIYLDSNLLSVLAMQAAVASSRQVDGEECPGEDWYGVNDAAMSVLMATGNGE